jgi:hypothetical protein
MRFKQFTPLNLGILIIEDRIAKVTKPVTSLDDFDGMTKNFHKDGLFSQEIFGLVGSDMRFKKYSWINMKVGVLHPEAHSCLVALKGLYGGILRGSDYAIWDDEKKDFFKSNALEGQTGYQFFIDHWKDIVFERNKSVQRSEMIDFLEKYKNRLVLDRLFVFAAGYRDLETDDTGRATSDDVNKLYKKVLAISNTVDPTTLEYTPNAYNTQRFSLQLALNEIYEYVFNILDGKNGMFMGKYASRALSYGTRNVITSLKLDNSRLGAKGNVRANHAGIGIYQLAKAIEPVAIFHLKNGFLSKVFTSQTSPALLCNPNTMRSERAMVETKDFDRWMTRPGLSDVINYYANPGVRNKPIMVGSYYLGLIYRGPDKTFKLLSGIDELPRGRNPEDCSPITYTDLLYIALYRRAEKYPLFVTRYPIDSDRSTFPAKPYLFSTIETEVRKELDDQWQEQPPEFTAYQFPVSTSDTFGSLAPHPGRLAKMKADFDGDMSSANAAMAEESIEDVDSLMNNKRFYVGADGQFVINCGTDTVKYVLMAMTRKVSQ